MNGADQHLPPSEKINELSLALAEAETKIAQFQLLLSEMALEHNSQQSQLIHDFASPLQIISMSLESVISKNPDPIFETMKRAADKMTKVLSTARQMKLQLSKKTTTV
ncbi:MAG: hypothetical protein HOP07_08100 [Bacteriovoracaceae bacterium]|nr:hypothetical protein [Bacteriovoracaceae bacterium]